MAFLGALICLCPSSFLEGDSSGLYTPWLAFSSRLLSPLPLYPSGMLLSVGPVCMPRLVCVRQQVIYWRLPTYFQRASAGRPATPQAFCFGWSIIWCSSIKNSITLAIQFCYGQDSIIRCSWQSAIGTGSLNGMLDRYIGHSKTTAQ